MVPETVLAGHVSAEGVFDVAVAVTEVRLPAFGSVNHSDVDGVLPPHCADVPVQV